MSFLFEDWLWNDLSILKMWENEKNPQEVAALHVSQPIRGENGDVFGIKTRLDDVTSGKKGIKGAVSIETFFCLLAAEEETSLRKLHHHGFPLWRSHRCKY